MIAYSMNFFYIYKYDLHVKYKWTKNRHSPGIKILRGYDDDEDDDDYDDELFLGYGWPTKSV